MHLTDLELAQARQKARAASRRMWLDKDDLFQEGVLAMLESAKDFQNDEHRTRYLGKRCFGAMIDYARTEARQGGLAVVVRPALESVSGDDDAPRDEGSVPCAASFGVAYEQLRKRVAREGSAYVEVLEALVDGIEPIEIAARLGVTPSRVSQLRSKIKEISRRYV